MKKTMSITFPEDVSEKLGEKDKPHNYVRNAVSKEIARESKIKTKVTITVKFSGTGYYTDDELTIQTHSVGRLKEKLSPLLDAVQQLQDVIAYLDP